MPTPSNPLKAVRGTRDLLPPETALWNRVESIARSVFSRYGFGEIRTPIFEDTQLFARGVGEETDIVSKEMYTWEDGERFDNDALEDCIGGALTERMMIDVFIARAQYDRAEFNAACINATTTHMKSLRRCNVPGTVRSGLDLN